MHFRKISSTGLQATRSPWKTETEITHELVRGHFNTNWLLVSNGKLSYKAGLKLHNSVPFLIWNFHRIVNVRSFLFGRFPGLWILCADVSEHCLFPSSKVVWTRITGTKLLGHLLFFIYFYLYKYPSNFVPVLLLHTTYPVGTECSETSAH
jgi:hypothetical protein